MKLVVDANILLAAFLKDSTTRRLLVDTRLSLFAPDHLLRETFTHLKNSGSLRKRIGLSTDEIQELLYHFTTHIDTIPRAQYRNQMLEAIELAEHRHDAPYLAVALMLKLPIWTNDKGFSSQSRVRVYSTAELIGKMG